MLHRRSRANLDQVAQGLEFGAPLRMELHGLGTSSSV